MNRKMTIAILLSLPLNIAPARAADAPQNPEAASAFVPSTKNIPELRWERRSDWLDVKTDVTPKAVGDGVADDTAALQAALDAYPKSLTVYLPAGTYRITKTLTLKTEAGPAAGFSLIGSGRLTKIVWDGGKTGGAMFAVPKGAFFARYIGVVWDGKNQAAVGFQHASVGGVNPSYETSILHRHEAFLNFAEEAVRMKDGTTDDLEFQNCLFENCRVGVHSYKHNDLSYTYDGCEFRNCGTGIFAVFGCMYVRNCHFENSAETDLRFHSTHSDSVRRSTSVGSKRFLMVTSPCSAATIQDCHVSGWKDPAGAIFYDSAIAASAIIMDCTFSEPPDTAAPAPVGRKSKLPKILSSGNLPPELCIGGQENVYDIPSSRPAGCQLPATQSFLKEKVALPGKIFDAVRDFGAAPIPGDATEGLQKAIDAARDCGNGALAYLPRGKYSVTNTLQVAGGNYSIGGAGMGSWVKWKTDTDQPVLDILDPDHVTLENIVLGRDDRKIIPASTVDILQHSTPGKPSFMTYDNVHVFGQYCGRPEAKGLHFQGLSPASKVLIKYLHGNVTFTDSAAANVLANVSYYGNLTVQGRSPARTGLLGFLTRFSVEKPYSLYVKNNQSLVMTDYYAENIENYAQLSGEDNDPPGRVTISGVKIHIRTNPKVMTGNILDISNYCGQVFLGPATPSYTDNTKIVQKGSKPCDIVQAAVLWFHMLPNYQLDTGGKLSRVGCQAMNKTYQFFKNDGVDDTADPDAVGKVAKSLDDFRRVGQLDLELNHPSVWSALGGGSADQPKPAEKKPAKP